MKPGSGTARVCADCATVVHDLSAIPDDDARRALAASAQCVRYLYDARGNVVGNARASRATVVPASALLSKRARRRWVAVASLSAAPLLLEACGPGDRPVVTTEDASAGDEDDDDDARAFLPADASVRDER